MKKLPLGIQTFSKIIDGDYLYIDKTDMALDIIQNNQYVFLSRPRRFGKSLLLDTIKEIFEGNKKLFEELAIYNKWNWEKNFPVIEISFSGGVHNKEGLNQFLISVINRVKKKHAVECDPNTNINILSLLF